MKSNGTTMELRFLLNGQTIELVGVDPNKTVLQYLREDRRATGSKEGCAEGDCGACTVAVGEIIDGELVYRSVNACIQFLASLHGKQLLTVEHVRASDGTLHPVQTALIENHGSQCGFCTPGFIMSMFVHYRENQTPSRAEVDDMLAGNLCRCTGYGPIIAAVQDAAKQPEPTEWRDRRAQAREILTAWAEEDAMLVLEGPSGRYFAPQRLADLQDVVARESDAVLVAGATDVGLWVTKMGRRLDPVVYLSDVIELRRIDRNEELLSIGAAVTYEAALAALNQALPSLEGLVARIGSRQIRNAGTIGGNIANGSPIGDMPPPLIAANAILVLNKGGNERRLNLEDFFLSYGKQDLATGEFVAAVEIPLAATENLRAYKISKRFDQDITAVLGAFNLSIKDGKVDSARICYGGMAATPQRAAKTEAALLGQDWTQATITQAKEAIAQDFTPLSDMRASADYRMRVAQNLLQKYFLELTQGSSSNLARRGDLAMAAEGLMP